MSLALTLASLLAIAPPPPQPAPVEQAIPEEATFALYEPRVRGDLLRAIGALQGIFGAEAAEAFLTSAPLPFLALEASAGDPQQAIDARGGIGLFRIAGIQASAGLVAVKRPDAVVADLAEHLGARVSRDGPLTWLYGSERIWAVLTEGSYLYLLIPDPQSRRLILDEQAPKRAIESLARAIRERRGSLADGELYKLLDRRVAHGQLALFLGGFEPQDAIRGALLRAQLRDEGGTLDGFVLGSRPLFTAPAGAPASPLLTRGPPHPFGIASLDARADELTAFFLGQEGSRRRQLARRAMTALGWDLEALFAATEGPITLAAYLQPPAREDLEEAPRSTLAMRLEARVRDPDLARAWLSDLRDRAGGDALRSSLRGGALRASLGPVPRGQVNLLGAARAVTGKAAFSPGHLTFLLDLVRIRHLLLAERTTASTEALERLNRVTEIDRAWLDLSGDPEGARVKGVLRLEME